MGNWTDRWIRRTRQCRFFSDIVNQPSFFFYCDPQYMLSSFYFVNLHCQQYQVPEITPTAIGKYIIEPLENAEEKHRYVARLTITDTTVYDQNDKYVLKIERKKDEDSEEIEEVKYE